MENKDWDRSSGCKSLIYLHIIFVVKYRRKAVTPAISEDIGKTFAEVLETLGCDLVEYGHDLDHVHVLVRIPPTISASDLAFRLKGRTSREVRIKYREELRRMRLGRHFWSPSYCVLSCGGAPLEVIKRYVEEQGRS